MKLKELAARISAHLRRFEADRKKINAPHDGREGGLRPYYHAEASVAGSYVSVIYISYQHGSHLTKAQAERYLAWLDAGNVGRHFEAFREAR